MRFSKLAYRVLCVLLLVAAIGCTSRPQGASEEVQGIVLRVDAGHKMLTLDHNVVPRMMQAQVMAYPVDSNRFLKIVKEGDTVLFSLMPHGAGEYSIATLRKQQTSKSKIRTPKRKK